MIPLEEREGTFEVIKTLIKNHDCYELDNSLVSVINVPLGNMAKMSDEDRILTLKVAQALAFERVLLVEVATSRRNRIKKSSNAFFDVDRTDFKKDLNLTDCYLSVHTVVAPFEENGEVVANIHCSAFIFEKPFKIAVDIVPDQYFIRKVSSTPHIRLC